MITSERTVGLQLRIFVSKHEQISEVESHLRQQFISVVQHYKKELEEFGNNEIQIHLVSPQRCPHCKQIITQCKCGRPARMPLVS